MGYPAFPSEESFPSAEQWNVNAMKAPRWGLPDPWSVPAPSRSAFNGPLDAIVAARKPMSGDFAWDPSDFGRAHRMGRKSTKAFRMGFGDPAFVPGTVPPPIPPTAWSPIPAPGPVFQPAGLPANPTEALALLTAQGQGPSGSTGISPTLTLAQAQSQAASQGMSLNADGTLTQVSQATGIPPAYLVAGLVALLLLK